MKTQKNLGKWILGFALVLLVVLSGILLLMVRISSVKIAPGETITIRDANGDDYYEISTADELYAFAKLVNDGNTDISALLTKDITVNEGILNESTTDARLWIPIGNDAYPYQGIFDGDGYTISGLYFGSSTQDYVGLFGHIGAEGTIQDVGIIGSYFNGKDGVGGVVGANKGTVQKCYNTGTVSGNRGIGGIVGHNYGTVANCYNKGEVCGNGAVGGVVGANKGIAANCYNTGAVSATQGVGGVVGYNYSDGTVENCYNNEKVSGQKWVGGVVGDNYDSSSTVTSCYNAGAVSGSEDVGGIVGRNGGAVTNCYYLDIACDGGINGNDVAGSAEAKTVNQFKSGGVAYLLQGTQEGDIWGQKIGTDDFPVLGGAKVYYGYENCFATEMIYSNTELSPVKDQLSGSS